jgi:hypothetical protein
MHHDECANTDTGQSITAAAAAVLQQLARTVIQQNNKAL